MVVINNVTDEKITKAMTDIKSNGGTVIGNTFAVSGVEGSYSQSGSTLTITITKKPWLASEGMIESKLREYFA